MKRHLSLFGLYARGSIGWLLALWGSMILVESALFLGALRTERLVRAAGQQGGLEQVLQSSHIGPVLAAGLLLTGFLLARVGCSYGSRVEYRLRRLPLSPRAVFFWQAGYNIGCYLLLWVLQTLLLLAFCRCYLRLFRPEGGQLLFLTCYRFPLLHSLLPLAQFSRWLRNLLLAAALGFSAAVFPLRQRQGKFDTSLILLSCWSLLSFVRTMGRTENDLFLILFSLLLIGLALYRALSNPDEEEVPTHETL